MNWLNSTTSTKAIMHKLGSICCHTWLHSVMVSTLAFTWRYPSIESFWLQFLSSNSMNSSTMYCLKKLEKHLFPYSKYDQEVIGSSGRSTWINFGRAADPIWPNDRLAPHRPIPWGWRPNHWEIMDQLLKIIEIQYWLTQTRERGNVFNFRWVFHQELNELVE